MVSSKLISAKYFNYIILCLSGTQTNIMLRLEDGKSHNFRFKSSRTLGSLISHIYNKYLIKTGLYDDKKKRMVLFSKIHNKCLTTLDSSQTLVDIKLHPSGVIYHNVDQIIQEFKFKFSTLPPIHHPFRSHLEIGYICDLIYV